MKKIAILLALCMACFAGDTINGKYFPLGAPKSIWSKEDMRLKEPPPRQSWGKQYLPSESPYVVEAFCLYDESDASVFYSFDYYYFEGYFDTEADTILTKTLKPTQNDNKNAELEMYCTRTRERGKPYIDDDCVKLWTADVKKVYWSYIEWIIEHSIYNSCREIEGP